MDQAAKHVLLAVGVLLLMAVASNFAVFGSLKKQQHKPEDDQPFFEKCQAHHFDLEQCRFFRYGLHDPADGEKEE